MEPIRKKSGLGETGEEGMLTKLELNAIFGNTERIQAV